MNRDELERKLLELASADQDALIAFFLRALSRREEAREALQETLVRAFEHGDRLPDGVSLRSWVWGIAGHVRTDMLRDRQSRRKRFSGLGADPAGREPEPSRVPEEDERTTRVKAALDMLPDDQRTAIMLNVYGGLTQPEIAESLGWTLAKVKNCAKAGHARLLDLLRHVDL